MQKLSHPRHRFVHLLQLPVLALVVVGAKPAWTCSELGPSLAGPSAPQTDEQDVPTNAMISIRTEKQISGVGAVLVDADGNESNPPVLDDGKLFVVAPTSLAPSTTYTLTFTVGDEFAGIENRDPIVFTTGTTTDDVAPEITSLSEDIEVEYDGPDKPTDGISSCGVQNEAFFYVSVPPPEATDDRQLVGFRLLKIDDNGGRVERDVRFVGADAVPLFAVETESGDATYVIEAFDLAGNVSESEPFVVELQAPLLDCSAVHALNGARPFGVFALLLAFAFSRRRRR